ncbi:MAG: sulfatase, partial [Myxococcota bacterium]|nr:sulfatase [Myxococcota bacterium]
MRGLLARSLLIGGLLGLLDGLFGLAALGFSARHVLPLLVVVALHQSLAVVLAVAFKILVPELRDRLPEHLRSWRQNAAGGRGEFGAALSWLVALVALVASLALAALAITELEGSLATKLYVQILQTLVSGVIFGAAALLTWRLGLALRSLAFRGPLTRQRLLISALFVGSSAYAYLWFERDLLFKEIPPVLGALLVGHLLAMLWAHLPAKGASSLSLAVQALSMTLILAILGGLAGAAPMLRRGAPASQRLIAALDPLIDWDGDGVSSHFGARDCAPFNSEIFPGAVDLPDDGVDQDCYRGDLSSAEMAVSQKVKLPDVGHIRRPQKVVLISIDALRPDRLGVYGYKKNRTSPAIDAWAKDAVIFDNAYTSGPYTIAAIPGLLTGRGISQIPNYLAEKGSYKLASELKTLPEIMRKLGYRTAAVTSGLQPRVNGFAQGIEKLWVVTKGKADTADKVAAIAKRWLAKASDKPSFLWLHFFDPHDPYKVIKGYNFGHRSSDRYDASIAFMDHHLGPLLKQLDEDPEAAVVLLADHGEAFGEHGATNHGQNVYRENARIPLIIKWRGAKPRRVAQAASILDILPTLVQLGGAKESPGFGQSLLPQLLGGAVDLGRGVLTESYRKGQLYALSTAS